MPTPRKIIHVDMDAFYASVEQRDNPALAGRPVVVAWRGSRSVVCAASYEARRFGVRSAMPALRAERLCPDAIFVPPDFPRYKAVSRQIREIFARHTDLIEPLSLDEAYLDVSCPKQNLGSATAIAQQIRKAIRQEIGLTASAGIAPNKFLAKIASDWNKPDGQFVLKPHQVADFLATLPLTRLPGVGRVTAARLKSLGLITCADVRSLQVEALEQALGRWGRRLHELAHGIDTQPVEPGRIASQISSEDTFAQDLPLAALDDEITRLAEKTWNAWLREDQKHPGRIPRTVVLKLKTADFRVLTRSITHNPMPGNAAELAEVAKALRQRVDLPSDTLYRLAGVGLAGFTEKDRLLQQLDLFA
ncbi:DNA polymerase IV [Lysobacteraceae bacterium NML120232]|nr:DNA polymerase IV [Xanthomonadaceae bacterium NML08-0793]PJK10879.1 DNA polymerase IV [Xanthomonadaceae bacterium NML120232]